MQKGERSGSAYRRAGAMIAIVALLAGASRAHAQDGPEDDAEGREHTALARELFGQGVEQSDAGRWEEAADLFRRSLALRESAVVSFNLGTALVHTGALVEASELFRRAARDPEAPARLQEAAARELGAVQPRIGRLTISVEGSLSGVELRLDERVVPTASLDVAAPVDPGDHVLVARRGDDEVARAEVSVAEGSAATVSLSVPAAIVDPLAAARTVVGNPSPPEPIVQNDDTGLVVGLVVGALALVGAAVAVILVLVLGQGPSESIPGNLTPGTIEL